MHYFSHWMPIKFPPFLKEKLKNPQSWKRGGDVGPGGGSRTKFFNPVISTKISYNPVI